MKYDTGVRPPRMVKHFLPTEAPQLQQSVAGECFILKFYLFIYLFDRFRIGSTLSCQARQAEQLALASPRVHFA